MKKLCSAKLPQFYDMLNEICFLATFSNYGKRPIIEFTGNSLHLVVRRGRAKFLKGGYIPRKSVPREGEFPRNVVPGGGGSDITAGRISWDTGLF